MDGIHSDPHPECARRSAAAGSVLSAAKMPNKKKESAWGVPRENAQWGHADSTKDLDFFCPTGSFRVCVCVYFFLQPCFCHGGITTLACVH